LSLCHYQITGEKSYIHSAIQAKNYTGAGVDEILVWLFVGDNPPPAGSQNGWATVEEMYVYARACMCRKIPRHV